MPFVRFSRDKRGYEHVYLIDSSKERGRSRVLYWFRTPPGVKVGRDPFDPDTQRSLERQNPDVQFDWPQIVAARMPPPVPVENWREKRRAERAIKRARAAEATGTAELERLAATDDVAPMAEEFDEPLEERDEGLADEAHEIVEVTSEPVRRSARRAAGGTDARLDFGHFDSRARWRNDGATRRGASEGGAAAGADAVRAIGLKLRRKAPPTGTNHWIRPMRPKNRLTKGSRRRRAAWHNQPAMTWKVNGFGSAAVLVLLSAGLAAQQPQQPSAAQRPTFTVRIDAVNMDVIVKDSQRTIRPRPEEGRLRDLRRRREAGHHVDDDEPRRAGHQRPRGAAAADARRDSAAPAPCGERHVGPHLPLLRRRPPPAVPAVGPRAPAVQEDFEAAHPRRRPVRHRLERPVVDLGRHDLRQEAARRGDQEDSRRRPEAERDHPAGGRLRGADRAAPSRARRVLDDARRAGQPGEGAQPPQGARVGQRGLRLQSVPGLALGLLRPDSPFLQNQSNQMRNAGDPDNPDAQQTADPLTQSQMQNETFSDADLAYELGEITRAANRANTTIYTIDPRGLVAGQDIDEQVDPQEWGEYVRKTQDTMRVLADETGGIAVVNQNDFDKALKRIDADSSDYYILGYYSSNPDPTHRRRKIEVKVPRGGLDVFTRTEYLVLKPPPRPVSSSRQ